MGQPSKALPLVVCTKGPIYKKNVDTSLHPLGIADPTSTCLAVGQFSLRMPHHTLDHTHPFFLSNYNAMSFFNRYAACMYCTCAKAYAPCCFHFICDLGTYSYRHGFKKFLLSYYESIPWQQKCVSISQIIHFQLILDLCMT